MECVLFGVGSPFVEEVRETLTRLGWTVAGGIRNVETAFEPDRLAPVVTPGEIPPEWLELPVLIPLVTPGHRRTAELDARSLGFHVFPSVIDPTVLLPAEPVVGEGTFVGAASLIGSKAVLGDQVCLNRGVTIGHHSQIGDYVGFGPAATLCGLVTVGRGAFVGAGAILGPSVTVGENAVVGAGAVVMRDVAPNTAVAGNPARLIREDVAGYNDVGV